MTDDGWRPGDPLYTDKNHTYQCLSCDKRMDTRGLFGCPDYTGQDCYYTDVYDVLKLERKTRCTGIRSGLKRLKRILRIRTI